MTPPPADLTVPIGGADSHQPKSLTDVHSSIAIPCGASSFWTKLRAFAGPGFLVAVGYMDPGNWATGIAAGSAFGYKLLSVVLLSSLMAVVLQSLAAKLGIATGRDLAQACRDSYGPRTRLLLWVICELAIIACDLAEVIGTAIALNLLFGLPLTAGVCVTALDVCLMLYLQNRGFRKLEAFVIALIVIIGACFAIELALAGPSLSAIASGLRPNPEVVRNPAMLYLSIGIIGATVMPHNLYLHSAIIQTRRFGESDCDKREASRFATIDSSIALGAAFLVNAAILILAAAAFHRSGHTGITQIQNAYRLLSPLLGTGIASALFAIALLASGQNSTITATLAGQVVMEGFLNIRLPAWQRRLVTRLIAIVPAAIVAASSGMSGTANLLLLSQVVLSLQLPFAIVPLVRFTSDRSRMGTLVNPLWLKITAYLISGVIIVLNLQLLRGLL